MTINTPLAILGGASTLDAIIYVVLAASVAAVIGGVIAGIRSGCE